MGDIDKKLSEKNLGKAGDKEGSAFEFNTWLATQEQGVQDGVTGHISGLKSAHDKNKESNKAYKTALDEMKASTATDKEKLNKLTSDVESANQKAEFFSSLPREVRNPNAAFILAREQKHMDGNGKLNLESFKEANPEQFSAPKGPKSSATVGEGSQTQEEGEKPDGSMNKWMADKAGVVRSPR